MYVLTQNNHYNLFLWHWHATLARVCSRELFPSPWIIICCLHSLKLLRLFGMCGWYFCGYGDKGVSCRRLWSWKLLLVWTRCCWQYFIAEEEEVRRELSKMKNYTFLVFEERKSAIHIRRGREEEEDNLSEFMKGTSPLSSSTSLRTRWQSEH